MKNGGWIIIEAESFTDTFSPKAQQKCLRIDAGTFEDLSRLGVAAAEEAAKATATTELINFSSTYHHHLLESHLCISQLPELITPSCTEAFFCLNHPDPMDPITNHINPNSIPPGTLVTMNPNKYIPRAADPSVPLPPGMVQSTLENSITTTHPIANTEITTDIGR